jgi:hypothetical protein
MPEMYIDFRCIKTLKVEMNINNLVKATCYKFLASSMYKVCPKSHETYFFAAPLLVAACSNRLGEVGGPLSS